MKSPETQKKRYCESEVIKKFLTGDRGITFLVDHAGEGRVPQDRKALRDQAWNIVDYYFAWTAHFPVKRTSRVSRYEFLKHLETFCAKTEVAGLFDFLFI